MRSYPIGAIMTPMLGLQVMLTESSVTPIDQNTHSIKSGTQRKCLVRRMLYILLLLYLLV